MTKNILLFSPEFTVLLSIFTTLIFAIILKNYLK